MELTDTSRGADSLVSLVTISNRVISQKLDVVLLPRVYIDKKKYQKSLSGFKKISSEIYFAFKVHSFTTAYSGQTGGKNQRL